MPNIILATGTLFPWFFFADCRHIAIASISACNYILSWNMKHFVKRKTMEMVFDVNHRFGVFQPLILTPAMFLEGDE